MYPMIYRDESSFINDTEVCNIGYNEGKLSDGRPYRLEKWLSHEIMNVTIFVSLNDIENLSNKEIIKMMEDNNIIKVIKDDIYITDVEDSNNNKFYSINVPLDDHGNVINELLVDVKDYDYE